MYKVGEVAFQTAEESDEPQAGWDGPADEDAEEPLADGEVPTMEYSGDSAYEEDGDGPADGKVLVKSGAGQPVDPCGALVELEDNEYEEMLHRIRVQQEDEDGDVLTITEDDNQRCPFYKGSSMILWMRNRDNG